MEFATAYLDQQKNALQKWKQLDFQSWAAFEQYNYMERFTPYFGLKIFDQLTVNEKRELYLGFVQFTAEVLIFFELMLLMSSRAMKGIPKEDPRSRALRAFAREEFYHLRAYRQFLYLKKMNHTSFLLRENQFFKNACAWVLKKEASSVFLAGVKAEIYSLQYTKLLAQNFPQNCDWLQLNIMHSKDEVHHCVFDFQFLDSYLKNRSFLQRVRFIGYGTLLYVLTQWIVLGSSYRLVRSVFKKVGRGQVLYKTFLLFVWITRFFTPYSEAKRIFLGSLQKKPFPCSQFVRFMAW